MADISKIQLESGTYNVKDNTARNDISIINLTIEGIQSDISDAEERIDKLEAPQSFTNKKYLLVGDSYATGYQGPGQDDIEGFYAKVVNKLGITAQIVASPGYGFIGYSNSRAWKDLIESTTIEDKDTFTDIIILGGMNDRGTDAQFETAMVQTFTYLETNFPNAEIHVGCIGKYAKTDNEQNLLNMRRVASLYKVISVQNGHKYIENSEIILHNLSWFISDNIHPNTIGESQIAYAIEQYIVNGSISHFMSVSSFTDWQTDTIEAASGITFNGLNLYSNIDGNNATFYIYGEINFSTDLTLHNLDEVTIGTLTSSYICASAYTQGLDECITGYVHTTDSNKFVKVMFKLFNNNLDNIKLKAFTVSDDGGVSTLTIDKIAFPYGPIKCTALSKYC